MKATPPVGASFTQPFSIMVGHPTFRAFGPLFVQYTTGVGQSVPLSTTICWTHCGGSGATPTVTYTLGTDAACTASGSVDLRLKPGLQLVVHRAERRRGRGELPYHRDRGGRCDRDDRHRRIELRRRCSHLAGSLCRPWRRDLSERRDRTDLDELDRPLRLQRGLRDGEWSGMARAA